MKLLNGCARKRTKNCRLPFAITRFFYIISFFRHSITRNFIESNSLGFARFDGLLEKTATSKKFLLVTEILNRINQNSNILCSLMQHTNR